MKQSADRTQITELVLLVLDVYGTIYANGQKITRPLGQSPARWQIMGQLEHESLTVSQLARRIGNSRQAVQRLADDMTRDKLTQFVENPDHHRSPKLELTLAGISTLGKINSRQRTWADRLAKEMSADAVSQTIRGVRRLSEALQTVEREFFSDEN
jgi:DNA-binding MarR family transcriptional regulator